MDIAKKAGDVLRSAEEAVRGLVGSAASSGDYEQTIRLTELARQLHRLAEAFGTNPGSTTQRADSSLPAPLFTASDKLRSRNRGGSAKKRRSAQYPRFAKSGDQLVKIAWSKKEREEYEHKAPRRAIGALAEAIRHQSGNGNLFTAEQLFPLRDPNDASEFPGYQGYVALAWLKSVGLVEQHGRSGYTTRKAQKLGEAVNAAWDTLPEHIKA